MHLDRELGIKPTDFVLDVGPGSLPFERANVLVDRWPGSEGIGQRGGAKFRTNGKKLVIADATALPFANQTFDFVMCSHIIEHIEAEHIEQFFQELVRVGRRGYIEAPSEIYEKMWNVKEHHWFIYVTDEDGIILRPKTPQNCYSQYTGVFWPLLRKTRGFRDFMDGYKDLFFVGYLWNGNLRWKTVDEHEEVVDWQNEKVVWDWIEKSDQYYKRYAESCLDPQVLRRRGRKWVLRECVRMSVPIWLKRFLRKLGL